MNKKGRPEVERKRVVVTFTIDPDTREKIKFLKAVGCNPKVSRMIDREVGKLYEKYLYKKANNE